MGRFCSSKVPGMLFNTLLNKLGSGKNRLTWSFLFRCANPITLAFITPVWWSQADSFTPWSTATPSVRCRHSACFQQTVGG